MGNTSFSEEFSLRVHSIPAAAPSGSSISRHAYLNTHAVISFIQRLSMPYRRLFEVLSGRDQSPDYRTLYPEDRRDSS